MRKFVTWILVVSLVATLGAGSVLAQPAVVGPPGLAQVEEILYGKVQEGSLIARVERAELDVLGTTQSSSALLVRIQRLVGLLNGAEGEISLKMKLNAVEWALFQSINEGPSIAQRLDQMERALYGETMASEGLVARLDSLLELLWPGGKVYTDTRELPARTLVKIELLTELNSERSRVGDPVSFRVAEDVRVNNAIVIPRGTVGRGEIIAVESAGRLGRDGSVQVDWGRINAIDSTLVTVHAGQSATERNRSIELAAGASLAGAVLLGGPIGLAAGYFIMGQNQVVPIGASFYLETAQSAEVTALSLVPTGGR